MQLLHYSVFICCLALTHSEDPPSSPLRPRLLILEELKPNCKPGSGVIFVPVLHQDCLEENPAVILGFFLNKSRKFGKMLSTDQVQMAASNQQPAGVQSTAAAVKSLACAHVLSVFFTVQNTNKMPSE